MAGLEDDTPEHRHVGADAEWTTVNHAPGAANPGAFPASSSNRELAVSEPLSIRAAFVSWLVFAVLVLVSSFYSFVTVQHELDEQMQELLEQNPDLDPDVLETSTLVGAYTASIVGLVFAVVVAIVAWKMRSGRHWARIVLTIIGVLQLLVALVGVVAAQLSAANPIIQIASVVCVTSAVVLLWVPSSREFFTTHRAVDYQS